MFKTPVTVDVVRSMAMTVVVDRCCLLLFPLYVEALCFVLVL